MKERKKTHYAISLIIIFISLIILGCEKDDNSVTKDLSIGDFYAGGIVFYIDSTGQHGLVCALGDQSTGIQWYNGEYLSTGATGHKIGDGKENTIKIIEKQGEGNYAAQLCNDLVLNDYNDWFLPSVDELKEVFKYKDLIDSIATAKDKPKFKTQFYWTSTEMLEQKANAVYFGSGGGSADWYYKNQVAMYVRAIREF